MKPKIDLARLKADYENCRKVSKDEDYEYTKEQFNRAVLFFDTIWATFPDLIELLEESQTLLSEVYRVAERYETPLLPHTVGSIECFLDKLKKEGEK